VNAPPKPSTPFACGVALGAGILSSLAFPPAGLWPIAFLSLVPLLWALRDRGALRGAVVGFCFGVGLFGASLYWILLFGEMAWGALVVLMAASAALFGSLLPAVTKTRQPFIRVLGVASLWILVDTLRTSWPLGGFGWSGLGVSQTPNPILLPIASVTGVWGITFVVVFVNAAVAELLLGGGTRRAKAILAVTTVVFVVAPAWIRAPMPEGRELDVATLQIDVRVPEGTSTVDEDLIVASRNIDLHRTLQGKRPAPDLVVWGEGALDPAALSDATTAAGVRDVIADVGVPTTIGAVVNDPDGTQTTSALAFDGQGNLVDRYDKVHLVPFGEYVPWRRRLDWIDAIDQIPVDRTRGERLDPIQQTGLPSYAAPICFENSFPAIPREFVDGGAEFLIVPVNNASYGFTAAAEQHLQMSQVRAAETARWVVDAGVSGISAFIDPTGHVVSSSRLFRSDILRERIRASTQRTWYVRMGDWLPWLCSVFVMALALIPRRRTAVRPAPGPLPAPARTLVILPTYNERDTIERALRGVLDVPSTDVLVVDDSSPDGTAEVVRTLAASDGRVRLLERPAKSGLASAYLEGFRVAIAEGYDLIVEMDSDLSHDPAALPGLLDAARRHHLVVGSRYVAGGSVSNWSTARVALSRAGNTYARWMLGIPIHDATSGYRVYRRELLEALMQRPIHADGYGFQVELVMRSHRLGFDVGESPITFREREFGESKISRSIVIEALWMVTRWGFDLRFRSNPAI
jgi:apolipoprotein N-acyltransferase